MNRTLFNTADLIDETEEGISLIQRKNGPYKGYWALPGGFLEAEQETLEEAGVRELREETGRIAKPSDLVLIGVYSEPDRDPRGHVISTAYWVKNASGSIIARSDAKDVRRFPRDKLPNLAFDHERILRDYFVRKKNGT